ncbi:M36 family metallopeptidase [Tahibacter soli]|uniref:M36 family metallopeptidase n=1 Tax=Tahibacter soli TaxID=2983605 RepID=A0A9X4BHS7_9GAMM|nr:M36 family metallopeptidase [Tahibacter soli]MDC8013226.1 M36 family metallopeptidase [Tahibacter soli]
MNGSRSYRWSPWLMAAAFAGAAHAAPPALDARTQWLGGDGPAAKSDAVPLAPATRAGRRAALIDAAGRGTGTQRADLVPAAVHQQAGAASVVQYRQEIDGVEVYRARLSVLLGADLAPRASGGALAAKTGPVAGAAFRLDAAQALAAALPGVDASLTAAPREVGQAGRYTRFALAATAEFAPGRPARIKRVWYPTAEGLEPAYYAEVTGTKRGADRPIGLALVVSADDGRTLASHSLIHDALPFSYRVMADANGKPYFDPYGFTNPHPTGLPDGWLPTVQAPMHLLPRVHGGISTGDPWLADDATQTRGNNVDAFFNAETFDVDGFCDYNGWGPGFNAAEGDFRAPVTGLRRFDYAYDVDLHASDYSQCDDAPVPIPVGDTQLNAKIVQMFYMTNWLHDLFYDLGYDEEAGNPQANNYGRGGIENDPLIVHAAYDTTFTFAPADGESPSVTYGFNTWTDRRDVSALDFGVLAHEWAHTMFGRLVGTSFYLGQEGALNEAIADFVGMFLMVRDQDRYLDGPVAFNGKYAVGAYMNGNYSYPGDPLPPVGTPGWPDNTYYHGIRRFPSTIDLAANPLTFKNIGVDHPVPQSANAYDWKQRSLLNSEIHTAGEVYTAALWQCSRNILAAAPRARFDRTHKQFLAWLVAGMKLTPPEPTYTEARDALLMAIRADDTLDYLRCRAGFAARGMGAGAIPPPRHSFGLRGTVESFDDAERALTVISTKLEEVSGADGDGVLDRGEVGRLVATVRNTGFSPLSHVSIVVLPQFGRYALPGGIAAGDVTLQPGEERTLTLPLNVATSTPSATLAIDVQALALQFPPVATHRETPIVVNYDLVRDSGTDALAAASTFDANWTREFTDPSNHGCARGMCSADTTVPGAYADMLDWQRVTHLGETAYRIGDERLTFDTGIATAAFQTLPAGPVSITLRHDYDFTRNQPSPTVPQIANGVGTVQIEVNGGGWMPIAPFVVSGQWQFTGTSGGWREDTIVLNPPLIAGRTLRLRLHARAPSIFYPDDAHWAISRVTINGAATPVFSTVHPDGS